MSNALEAASLIMVPSGYENGTLASVKPNDGTGDFTFSRGSNLSATRINEQGYIEKGYENLLLQSNSFTTSPWSSLRASLTSGQAGYDGSSDAWLLESTSFGQTKIQVSNSANGVNTISFHAKAGSVNYAVPFMTSTTARAWFNLSNGTIESSFSNIDASIEDVGNGWYRCSMAFNGSASNTWILACPTNNLLDSEIGDNIYIQNAMINQGLVSYPYIETTTAPVAGGILEDMPRLDYSNGSCPALLLEPQRTNLIPHSEYFDTDWSKIQISVSTNQITSPSGKKSASKIIEDNLNTNFQLSRNLSVTSGVTYTISIFAKSTERYLQIKSSTGFPFSYANFDLINGVLGTDGGSLTPSINSYGDGWYRCSVTFTATSTTNGLFVFHIVNSADAPRGQNYQGDGTSGIYIYGAQLEQDATYPTSYIPTYGVSQTRLDDSCLTTGIESLVTSQNGTMFAHINPSEIDGSFQFSLSDGLTSNRFTIRRLGTNTEFIVVLGGSVQIRISTINQPLTTDFKFAGTWTAGYSAFFINGVKIGDDQQFTLSGTINRFGFDNGYNTSGSYGLIQQALLFPTALTDSECIELTTI